MADEPESTARKETVIPPPPRATGDPAVDSRASVDWIWQFYQAAVVQSGLLDPAFQSEVPTFDPDNLPDPANSSIAQAQQTANEAFKLAQGS